MHFNEAALDSSDAAMLTHDTRRVRPRRGEPPPKPGSGHTYETSAMPASVEPERLGMYRVGNQRA